MWTMSSDRCVIELPSPDRDRVRCVMSLRGDGAGLYDGFNACHYVGDTPEHVADSRSRLARELDISPGRLVIPRQTHSVEVATISGESDLKHEYVGVDALVTSLSGVALCVNTADCVPVVLSDVANGVIGIAHSGWRGAVGRIAAKTVEAMAGLGADPAGIDVLIGAHICTGCFEVGEEVAEQFLLEFPGGDGDIVHRGYDKPHIDLSAAVIRTLKEAGVDASRIADIGICSRCGDIPLFSARRDGIASGRTLTAVMLR